MKPLISQVSTNRLQSDRLISIGLLPQTADITLTCCENYITKLGEQGHAKSSCRTYSCYDKQEYLMVGDKLYSSRCCLTCSDKSSWSLSRLIELMPISIETDLAHGDLFISHKDIAYFGFNNNEKLVYLFGYEMCDNENIFDVAIDMIEHLIKNGYMHKEYLK